MDTQWVWKFPSRLDPCLGARAPPDRLAFAERIVPAVGIEIPRGRAGERKGAVVGDQRARQFGMERCLGRGRFGEVYLATMRSRGGLETRVALKLLHRDLAVDATALARLRDEGRVLARVRHPGIVLVFDITQVEGRLGLITEYVDGCDLDQCANMPLRACLQAIGAVASALSAAHHAEDIDGKRLEVVHRDVKSTNIRLGRHGQVKLLDFGVASFESDDREADTLSAMLGGAIPYLAPERISDRRSLPAGDVYGLGCCLYERIVGERLHVDGTLRAMTPLSLDAQRFDAVVAERLDRIDPAPLRHLLAQMLAWRPADRPAAAAVAVQCELLADATRATNPTPGLRRWCHAQRSWPDTSFEAALSGRTVTEGALPPEWITWAPESGEAEPEPTVPRKVRTPVPTIDPAAFTAAHTSWAAPSLLPEGSLLGEPPVLVTTDSVSRPRTAAPAVSAPGGGTRIVGPTLTGIGCATAAVLASLVLGVSGVLLAWFGLP